MIDRQLLLNRRSVAQLSAAGLAELVARPLSLSDARRLGLWQGTDGTGCYLWSLVLAAMRQMIGRYFQQRALDIDPAALHIGERLTHFPQLSELWSTFLDNYPRPDLRVAVTGTGRAVQPQRLRLTGELFLLSVQLENPAAEPWQPLFDDRDLVEAIAYRPMLTRLEALLEDPSAPGPWQARLGDLLRAPLRAAPQSLTGQLGYILSHWSTWLPRELLESLELARAVAEEEAAPRNPGPGPSASPFVIPSGDELPAAFTRDRDWMADSVLIAKSIYIWLDQLSRQSGRALHSLSDIPDQELDRLAGYGFNALWLIGLWERSPASRRIKQLAGNPEAEASAYALRAYRVADDLGGEAALDDLAARCSARGIRLACDVVPNHTGIDSEWLFDHPDWFVQCAEPPYPGYRFSGPDLSDRPGISLRIEDGYWNHSDAAVVFEHHTHSDNRRRYLYHGNDGTSMPWNDTAQLNFLLPEVRQAMSDLIIEVARRFRLIRFDAAMTLARKHYRRLWFPAPGGSAGVPSRSLHWMSDTDFDRAFPTEFWRDVVDRINRELPETLLIAEAFWLMESYFVRTLGMHRVYNSAFMNMLKREENAEYRQILKETLAFNPEILKRYVNFMNNPDEATAVAQFGKGDKYFGVAVLLASLPGLPMFGHGQIEGLAEKYGMEYRRAYWAEQPDQGFIDHHQRTVFPLLRRRWVFSGVEQFTLYDFLTDGGIDDNVYAFSNGPADQRHLVLYNNSPHPTRGWIHQAAPKAAPEREGVAVLPAPFAGQFALQASPLVRCRDLLSGNAYLLHTSALQQGLKWSLAGYQVLVLNGFELIDDPDGYWNRLATELGGQAVADLDQAMLRLRYAALWTDVQALLDPGRLRMLSAALNRPPLVAAADQALRQLRTESAQLTARLRSELQPDRGNWQSVPALENPELEAFASWLTELAGFGLPGQRLGELWLGSRDLPGLGVPLLSWWLVDQLCSRITPTEPPVPGPLLERFGLDLAWRDSWGSTHQQQHYLLCRLLLKISDTGDRHPARSDQALLELVAEPMASQLLGINRHAGMTWFNRERMTDLCGALALQAAWQTVRKTSPGPVPHSLTLAVLNKFRQRLARAAAIGYQLDKFLIPEARSRTVF